MNWAAWFGLGIVAGVAGMCIAACLMYTAVLHSRQLTQKFTKSFMKAALNKK
jgi:hypothetical protein